MKNFNFAYLLVFLIASLIFSLKILDSNFAGVWQVWLLPTYFVIGGVVGHYLFYFDRIVDIYISNPETKLAIVVKEYFSRNKYKEGIEIIKKNNFLQKRLVFRSVLFQVVWIFLMFFVITSVSSSFGKGFIFGLGLKLLIEEWNDFVKDKKYLIEWLFWPVNIKVDESLLKKYLMVMSGLTLFFFSMLVR